MLPARHCHVVQPGLSSHFRRRRRGQHLRTHRDVHLSLKWMDSMGVDYVSMFPTPMLLLGLHPQPEIEAQMSRA